MLWWGRLAFNAGSTFGVTENKWQLSARACCTTLMASVSGGWVALIQSYFMNNKKQDQRWKQDIYHLFSFSESYDFDIKQGLKHGQK